MKIIVGLGNPGFRYKKTRHNVGFSVITAISKQYKIRIKKKGFSGNYGIGRINGWEVLLFEPMTYMNLSGQAVNAVCSSKLGDKKDLLIISDDINLPLGTLRLREKGSAGGHNGLKSIIGSIGEDFCRLRIGVAAENMPVEDMVSFVLSRFSRKEFSVINDSIEKTVECVDMWVEQGIKEVMGRYN